MIKIGLDLAHRTCGLAIVAEDKLLYDSKTITSRKLTEQQIQWEMTEWIFGQIQSYLGLPNVLTLEGIFKGRNFKFLTGTARTQGAVTDRYIKLTSQFPQYIMAADARQKLGITTTLPKVGIQSWVIETFHLGEIEPAFTKKIWQMILKYAKLKNSKRKIDQKLKKETKKDLDMYSKKVAMTTGVDEHMADAIVLAVAS